MNTNRRKFSRRPVDIKATVVGDSGMSRLAAAVLDLSESGVRVRLVEEELIPTECYILFGNRMEPCRLVWQTSRSAGLVFTA
ncbi:PilZ domain-containing protein [Devosia sp. 2618]|uniref:PilZ domain-containing protein n=1 Tax=Devosia sp. 2618 TaxID=3156454 RepID=UPI003394485A